MYTLGIETSCDETSCAILKKYRVLSNVTLSSLREHSRYGGVVPEIATRAHLVNINLALKRTQQDSGVALEQVRLIAATYRPGLFGALAVGLNFAKALSLALRKPFIGVDHLQAHLFSPFLDQNHRLKFPFVGLVVSGGHTDIYLTKDFGQTRLIGQSCDDACGEVFDKVARAYGLGYPGGPVIDRMFAPEHQKAFVFRCGRKGLDLSFSGLKTALLYKRQELIKQGLMNKNMQVKLLSSFQAAAVEAIMAAVTEACRRHKLKRLVCGGGVIANSFLRQRLASLRRAGYQVFMASSGYAQDNAAMVAGLGFYLYNRKSLRSGLGLKAEAN